MDELICKILKGNDFVEFGEIIRRAENILQSKVSVVTVMSSLDRLCANGLIREQVDITLGFMNDKYSL